MTRGRMLGLGLAALALASGGAHAAPRWRLALRHGPLQWIQVTDALGRTTVYHYLNFTVENATGEARRLALSLRIVTDVDRTVSEGWYPDAEEAIERLHRRDFKNIRELRGELPDGEEVEGIAIFREVPPLAHRLDVRVNGLTDLVTREGGKVYAERKAMSLRFVRSGDEYERHLDVIRKAGEGWVVEERREIRYR